MPWTYPSFGPWKSSWLFLYHIFEYLRFMLVMATFLLSTYWGSFSCFKSRSLQQCWTCLVEKKQMKLHYPKFNMERKRWWCPKGISYFQSAIFRFHVKLAGSNNILSLFHSIVSVEEQPEHTLSNDCFGVTKMRKIQMQSFLMTVLTDGMGCGGSKCRNITNNACCMLENIYEMPIRNDWRMGIVYIYTYISYSKTRTPVQHLSSHKNHKSLI